MRGVGAKAGAGLLLLMLVAGGCGSDGSTTASLTRGFSPAAVPAVSGSTRTKSYVVAEVQGPAIEVFSDPSAPAPALNLTNPTSTGAPRVMLALTGSDGWVKVLLPVRPNVTTGWIRMGDVVLKENPYGVRVELSRHRISVWKDGEQVLEAPAGIGREATGTPKGVYYLTELLRSPNPSGPYGPFAFGTSAFSEVLTHFAGGEGVIGIHGTNDPGGVGKDVSHGCIRVANDVITRLAGMLPLGTPVFIIP